MKYAVRIVLEVINPAYWPTLKNLTYSEVMTVAKPWIDGGYMVEITPIGEGDHERTDS